MGILRAFLVASGVLTLGCTRVTYETPEGRISNRNFLGRANMDFGDGITADTAWWPRLPRIKWPEFWHDEDEPEYHYHGRGDFLDQGTQGYRDK